MRTRFVKLRSELCGTASIGFNFGTTISIITSGFATAFYPFFMSYLERQEECKYIFGRIFTYYTLGVGFITLLFFILAKPLVMILTNEAFHNAYIVIGLVASSHYFIGFYNLFLPGIYYNKEVSVQSAIQGVSVIVFSPIVYFSVKYWGVFGAALSVAIGHFFMAVFTHLWNFYRRKMYLCVQYEWGRVGRFALVYLITATVFITNDLHGFFENIVLSLVALLVVFCVMLLLLNRSELKYLLSLVEPT